MHTLEISSHDEKCFLQSFSTIRYVKFVTFIALNFLLREGLDPFFGWLACHDEDVALRFQTPGPMSCSFSCEKLTSPACFCALACLRLSKPSMRPRLRRVAPLLNIYRALNQSSMLQKSLDFRVQLIQEALQALH